MPLISEFFGIKILMFWNEHFQAEYGKEKALISIREAAVLKGGLPPRTPWSESPETFATRPGGQLP